MITKVLTHVHKVVITYWCWHICEGDGVWAVEKGLGPSLPLAELASTGFRCFRGLEMPIFHYAGSRKRNGGERRSQRWPDTAPDAVTVWPNASGQFNAVVRRVGVRVSHRRIRLGTQKCSAWRKADRTRDTSGHTRSDASGHWGSLLDSNRTLPLSRPVVVWSASDRCFAGARCCAIGASGRLCSVSGRCVWPLVRSDRWRFKRSRLILGEHVDGAGRSDVVQRVWSVSTGASGRPEKCTVKGYNGSIRLGWL
jgi:hypothetical protein